MKNGDNTQFAILDAGMTDLIRPALYQAFHKIENLSSVANSWKDMMWLAPICESSDTFGKYVELPETRRGDLDCHQISRCIRRGDGLADIICRDLPGVIFSDEI
ncbi:MAG: hypothetical protein MZV63_60510 [Marinilabiliales bacterium]|nr:hypothetical protein [Marinilabiliales bacterium]